MKSPSATPRLHWLSPFSAEVGSRPPVCKRREAVGSPTGETYPQPAPSLLEPGYPLARLANPDERATRLGRERPRDSARLEAGRLALSRACARTRGRRPEPGQTHLFSRLRINRASRRRIAWPSGLRSRQLLSPAAAAACALLGPAKRRPRAPGLASEDEPPVLSAKPRGPSFPGGLTRSRRRGAGFRAGSRARPPWAPHPEPEPRGGTGPGARLAFYLDRAPPLPAALPDRLPGAS